MVTFNKNLSISLESDAHKLWVKHMSPLLQSPEPEQRVTSTPSPTAVGEGVDVTLCSGSGDCNNGDMCLTHNLWASLSREIDRFLLKVTIDKLVQTNQDDVDNLLSGVSDSLIRVSSVG